MRLLACSVLVFLAATCTAHGDASSDDSRYVRAHTAAVKYRRQRDHLQRLLTRRVHEATNLRRALVRRASLDAVAAIRLVFGQYAGEAIRVSSCETGGTFDTGATNGQYLGLFQMGDYARATYGHSDSALGQAQAAYRYFVASGRDWSPWECKP